MPSRNRSRTSYLSLILLTIAAALVPLALRTSIDNRLERWIEPKGDERAHYAEFQKLFGSDEFVFLAYSGLSIFEEESLDIQLEALERLEETPNVSRVLGIPAVYRDIFGLEDAEAFRDEILSTSFYKSFLVSNDGSVAGFLIETTPPDEISGRRDLMRGIRSAIVPLKEAGWKCYVVGPPELNVELDRISRKEITRAFPLAIAISLAVLWLTLGSFRAVAITAFCCTVSVIITLGLMAGTGRSLNMVTSALPPLLWVLAMSNQIHLLNRYMYERAEGATLDNALANAKASVFAPCALASVTTAFGFLSLVTASMQPIREFGIFAAVGLLVSFAVNFSIGPSLIGIFNVPPRGRLARTASMVVRESAALSIRSPRTVIVVAAVLFFATFAVSSRIKVESNPLSFLPKDSPTAIAYNIVAEELTGLYSLEVVLSTPGGWLEPELWPHLENVQRTLEELPSVARVLTPVDMLKKFNQWDHDFDPEWYVLPETGAQAYELIDELDDGGRAMLDPFVTSDDSHVRLSVLIREMDSNSFISVVERADEVLNTIPLEGYTTGIILQVAKAQLALVLSQLRAFALAFVTVFACILIGLRSWRLTVLSIIPNILPLLGVFCIMGLFRINLDAATVMVVSISLGIAVDDTVHLLATLKRNERPGGLTRRQLLDIIDSVGPALLVTTVAAATGFLALNVSGFLPLRQFGRLATVAICIALAADVCLLPAILALRHRFAENSDGN